MNKSKSFLFVLAVCQLSIAPVVHAQNSLSGTDTSKPGFLWFHGTWKSKNVFTTTPYAASFGGGDVKTSDGSTVTITPDGEVHISSGDVDSWNKKIDNGLNDLQKFQDQMSNQVNEWVHHFSEASRPELEDLKSEWTLYKVDKSEDMMNAGSKEQQEKTGLQNFVSSLNSWCTEIRPKYDAIISFYQAHRHDKDGDYNNPAPPEADFNCVACDTTKAKQNNKQADDYVEKFFKPESNMIRDGLSILRQLILIGRSNDIDNTHVNVSMDQSMTDAIDNAFKNNRAHPDQSGACTYLKSYELNSAIQFLVMRCYWRAKKLLKDYRTNIKTAPAVIRTVLSAARQNMLMGFNVDDKGDMAECGALVKKEFDYYYNKLVQEHDWSQLANIPFILGLSRNYAMLTGNTNDVVDLNKLAKLLNSFTLQIEMDAKLGKGGAYYLSHLKGEVKIAPEFNYNNDTCYRWVVVEGTNGLGFPLKKGSQKIECDLLANEMIVPAPERPVYAGTRKYYTLLYGLKMDYCHPGEDSIFLSSFIAEPNAMAGIWNIPHSRPAPLGLAGTDGMFRDVNKMKELAESGKLQQGADEMKEQGEKIVAQMKALQHGNGGVPDVATMQKMQDLATQARSLSTNQNVAPILTIDFPLQIQNNSVTLHEKRFDAKQVNPREADVIVYGYYTVKVIYKPDQK